MKIDATNTLQAWHKFSIQITLIFGQNLLQDPIAWKVGLEEI